MTIMLAALLIVPVTATPEALELQMTAEHVTIKEQTGPVLIYRYRNFPKKPYVMEWFTPGRLNVLRDAPSDHLHHHGLMFAITVEGVNFWEETTEGGEQLHRGCTGVNMAPADANQLAVISESLDWRAPASETPLLVERRRISILHSPDPGARLLHWQSQLHCPDDREQVSLSGRIYHGLGMRFPEFFDDSGAFLWAADKSDAFKDGIHYLARASWCAIRVVTEDGKTGTVAMFDAPGNPRPALWFTMDNPFAYLSATLDLSRAPLSLAAGAPLTLDYGVAAWDEAVDAEQIDALYRSWLAP